MKLVSAHLEPPSAQAVTQNEINPLMFSAMTHEHLLAHISATALSERARDHLRIELLRRTVSGFATNATACKACAMSNQIANEALERDDHIKEMK